MDDLLKVLDMSKDEQWKWCQAHTDITMWGGHPETLADLAFRFRDEACKISCEKYYAGLEAIYEHRGIKKQCQSFYAFLTYRLQPIDMIIAALIAKDKDGGD